MIASECAGIVRIGAASLACQVERKPAESPLTMTKPPSIASAREPLIESRRLLVAAAACAAACSAPKPAKRDDEPPPPLPRRRSGLVPGDWPLRPPPPLDPCNGSVGDGNVHTAVTGWRLFGSEKLRKKPIEPGGGGKPGRMPRRSRWRAAASGHISGGCGSPPTGLLLLLPPNAPPGGGAVAAESGCGEGVGVVRPGAELAAAAGAASDRALPAFMIVASADPVASSSSSRPTPTSSASIVPSLQHTSEHPSAGTYTQPPKLG